MVNRLQRQIQTFSLRLRYPHQVPMTIRPHIRPYNNLVFPTIPGHRQAYPALRHHLLKRQPVHPHRTKLLDQALRLSDLWYWQLS